jgi:hypothetical protein
LLLVSFGGALAQTLRDDDDLMPPFERLAIGVIGLMAFEPLLGGLWTLGNELTQLMERLGPQEGLKDFILSSLVKAGTVYRIGQPKDWNDFWPNAVNNVKGNP